MVRLGAWGWVQVQRGYRQEASEAGRVQPPQAVQAWAGAVACQFSDGFRPGGGAAGAAVPHFALLGIGGRAGDGAVIPGVLVLALLIMADGAFAREGMVLAVGIHTAFGADSIVLIPDGVILQGMLMLLVAANGAGAIHHGVALHNPHFTLSTLAAAALLIGAGVGSGLMLMLGVAANRAGPIREIVDIVGDKAAFLTAGRMVIVIGRFRFTPGMAVVLVAADCAGTVRHGVVPRDIQPANGAKAVVVGATTILLIRNGISIPMVMLLIVADFANTLFIVGMWLAEPDMALGAGAAVAFPIHIHDGGVGHIVGVVHAAAGFADTVYKVMLFLDPLVTDGAKAFVHIPEGVIIVYFMFVGGVAAEGADIILHRMLLGNKQIADRTACLMALIVTGIHQGMLVIHVATNGACTILHGVPLVNSQPTD